MNRRVLLGATSTVILAIVALALLKASHRSSSEHADAPVSSADAQTARSPFGAAEQSEAHPYDSSANSSRTRSGSTQDLSLRHRLHEANDYARFVAEIRPLAEGGDPEAAYVVAKSLRWCSDTSRLYFIRPSGDVRTLEEIQATFSYRSVGVSSEVIATWYTRCRGFLTSAESRKELSTWNEWLDKAAEEGSPAAIAANAANLQDKLLMETRSQDAHPTRSLDAANEARDAALGAAESGDPDALFLMSGWIDAAKRTDSEYSTLVSAWQIVACQNGYECGSDSDWMTSVCTYDPQCSKDRTYVGYLQRSLGSQYEDAVRIAASIQSAILARDALALRVYL